MIELRLISAKDLRRLRWLLATWLLVVAGRVVLQSVMADVAFDDNVLQLTLGNLWPLLAVADVLLLVLLVSRLIHDEPLVGADAFWLTRPIRPTMLMITKLVFAAIFLVAAPIVVQSAAAAAVAHDARSILAMIPALLVGQLLWVAVLVTVASLTATTTRFLLTLVAVVAALVLAISIAVTSMTPKLDGLRDTLLPDETGEVLFVCLVLAVGGAVMNSQYRMRQVRRSIVIGVGAAVVGAIVVAWWPWHFAKPVEPDPGTWARDPRTAPVVDRDLPPYVFDLPSRYWIASGEKKQVAMPIRLTGMPATYAATMSIQSKLLFSDGTTIESSQTGSAPVRLPESQARSSDSESTLRAAMAPARQLMHPESDWVNWPTVLVVSDADLTRYGTQPGRLTMDMTVLLLETHIVGSLPLVDGATTGVKPRFELRRTLSRGGRFVALIRAIGERSDNGPHQLQFVLRNNRRSEFMLGNSEPLTANAVQLGGLTFSQFSGSADFSDLLVSYPPRGGPYASAALDADWLRDADIVVVDRTYRGRLSRTLTVDGFTMKR